MRNPRHLRTLTTVLQTGSFAVAGRRLGYTPSAVSRQIAALERAVRLPLLEREARSIRPTPAAAFLAAGGRFGTPAVEGVVAALTAAAAALHDPERWLIHGAALRTTAGSGGVTR